MFTHLRRYLPEAVKIDAREQARSLLGVLLGLLVTGLLSQALLASHPLLPWLIGPIGASAVLLFALPASPLAQPWSMFGGNVLSAMVGLACAHVIHYPPAAAGIAVAIAIAAMFACRCLHPPGGAIALGMALGGSAVAQQGIAPLAPVALNSLLLLTCAIVYNKLCGRRYPHWVTDHSNQHQTADALPTERLGITPADLDAVLKQYNQVFDISRDDLEEIMLRTEMHAYQRRFGGVTCRDIMSRDVVKVEYGTPLQQAWRLLRQHKIKALPVINEFNRVIGIVTQHDFLKQGELDELDGFSGKLRRFLKQAPHLYAKKAEVVGDIMTPKVHTASVDQPIVSLVPLFSDSGLHHLPVVDNGQRLIGILTQSDLIAALYRTGLEQDMPRNAA